MAPYLLALKASNRFLLAALSNTLSSPDSNLPASLNGIFDIYISTCAVGMRKQEPDIYALTLRELNRFASGHVYAKQGTRVSRRSKIKPEDVLFLDDIGENLKAAKEMGFRTMKVGRDKEGTKRAVLALKSITGVSSATQRTKERL